MIPINLGFIRWGNPCLIVCCPNSGIPKCFKDVLFPNTRKRKCLSFRIILQKYFENSGGGAEDVLIWLFDLIANLLDTASCLVCFHKNIVTENCTAFVWNAENCYSNNSSFMNGQAPFINAVIFQLIWFLMLHISRAVLFAVLTCYEC